MKRRIAPRGNFIYKYEKLSSDFLSFTSDLAIAIKDKTGVPSMLSGLNFMKKRLVDALTNELTNDPQFAFMVGKGEFEAEVKRVKEVILKLKKALRAFEPVPFSQSEIQTFTDKIYSILRSFKTSGVKY